MYEVHGVAAAAKTLAQLDFFYCVHLYNTMLIFEYFAVSECNKIRLYAFAMNP